MFSLILLTDFLDLLNLFLLIFFFCPLLQKIEHFPFKCTARIRYNSIGAEAVLMNENNQIICKFSKPQLAITPGQSMVFYLNDSILGGGIIEKQIQSNIEDINSANKILEKI